MRNPFRTEYSGSAREKYKAQGSKAAQDAEDMEEARRQVRAEKNAAKVAAAKVASAQSKVAKCARSKVKPGQMKCGSVGTGIYCKKHTREGTIIANG